jgi:hypothetical protein
MTSSAVSRAMLSGALWRAALRAVDHALADREAGAAGEIPGAPPPAVLA